MMKIQKIISIREFKKWIEKEIGKRCRDYCWDCFVCRSWRVYDEMEGYVNHIIDLEISFTKKTKK